MAQACRGLPPGTDGGRHRLGRSFYPYLATITSHPAPEDDPGVVPCILALCDALDAYPIDVRGRIIHHIVALGAALDEPDIQAGLDVLAQLSPEDRTSLFSDGARAFREIVNLQRELDDRRGEATTLATELQARRDQAIRDVEVVKAEIAREGMVTKACRHTFDACIACLAPANVLSGPVGAPSPDGGARRAIDR